MQSRSSFESQDVGNSPTPSPGHENPRHLQRQHTSEQEQEPAAAPPPLAPPGSSQAHESAAVLQRVLLPSLQAAAAGRDQGVLQAVAAIQGGLVQLEKMVRWGEV